MLNTVWAICNKKIDNDSSIECEIIPHEAFPPLPEVADELLSSDWNKHVLCFDCADRVRYSIPTNALKEQARKFATEHSEDFGKVEDIWINHAIHQNCRCTICGRVLNPTFRVFRENGSDLLAVHPHCMGV